MGFIVSLFVLWLIFIPIIIYLMLFATFIMIIVQIAIYLIMAYIFNSISIMSICSNLNYKKIFLSWIPIYNKYLLSKMIGDKILGAIKTLINIIVLSVIIYCYIKSNISYITIGILVIFIAIEFILNSIIAYKIYKKATNKYGDILTVFNVLTLGMLSPIFLFIIRNKIKIVEEEKIEIINSK